MKDPCSLVPTCALVSIDDVYADPDQPRMVIDETTINVLAGSVAAIGIVQPLLVRNVDGKTVIVDGHQRWFAGKRAGLTQVPVVYQETELSLCELARQQLATYCRSDLNPMDRSDAIARLIKTAGSTASMVASEIGLSEGQVSKLLALQLLSDADKARVRAGTLGMAEAYRLASGGDTASIRRAATASHRSHRKPVEPPARLKLAEGVNLIASATTAVPIDLVMAELAAVLWRLGRLQSEGMETHAAFAALATTSDTPPEDREHGDGSTPVTQ